MDNGQSHGLNRDGLRNVETDDGKWTGPNMNATANEVGVYILVVDVEIAILTVAVHFMGLEPNRHAG